MTVFGEVYVYVTDPANSSVSYLAFLLGVVSNHPSLHSLVVVVQKDMFAAVLP